MVQRRDHSHLDQVLRGQKKQHLTVDHILSKNISQLWKSDVVEPEHYLQKEYGTIFLYGKCYFVNVHAVCWFHQTISGIPFDAIQEATQSLPMHVAPNAQILNQKSIYS